MDLGASVAFVAEPPAADAMRQPPRDPSRPFLDRAQVAAIALTAVALTAAALPAFLVVSHDAGTEAGSAAAIGAWLVAHAAIAWSLRARPQLAWRDNVAFPAWALTATLTAIVLALTPAVGVIGIEQLTLTALAITTAAATGGVALAAAGRRVLSLPRRL